MSSRMSLDHHCPVEQHHRFTGPGLEHLPSETRLGFYHLLVLNLRNSFRSPPLNLTPSPPEPHEHPREAGTPSPALQLRLLGSQNQGKHNPSLFSSFHTRINTARSSDSKLLVRFGSVFSSSCPFGQRPTLVTSATAPQLPSAGGKTPTASSLTSARVILHEELVQGHPSPAHADHDRAPQDTDQPQLLGIAELRGQGRGQGKGSSRGGNAAPSLTRLHQRLSSTCLVVLRLLQAGSYGRRAR